MKDYGPVAVEQHPVLRVPGHRPGQDLCLDVPAGLGLGLAQLDLPASSAWTRRQLSWTTTGPDLLTDLRNMDYSAA